VLPAAALVVLLPAVALVEVFPAVALVVVLPAVALVVAFPAVLVDALVVVWLWLTEPLVAGPERFTDADVRAEDPE